MMEKNIIRKNKKSYFGIIVLVIVIFCFHTFNILWTIGQHYGYTFWGVLPASWLNCSKKITNMGWPFLFGKEGCGWDGQYYYAIALDIFDKKSNFWQGAGDFYTGNRVGLPLVAAIVSVLIREPYTYPLTFLITQAVVVSIAAFFYMQYMNEGGYSILAVLPWAFSYGIIITVRDGLVDPFGDAFFIMAFLFFLKEKWRPYAILMSVAVLGREFFVVPAFLIFCFSIVQLLKGNKEEGIQINLHDGMRLILVAIPGITYVIWQFILCKVYSLPLIHIFSQGSRLAMPLKEWYIAMNKWVAAGNRWEIFWYIIFVIVVVMAIISVILASKRNNKYMVMIFPIFSLLMLPDSPMGDQSGIMKVVGSAVLLIPLSGIELKDNFDYGKNSGEVIRVAISLFLVCYTMVGIWYGTQRGVLGLYVPHDIYLQNGNDETWFLSNQSNQELYDELPCEIRLVDTEDNIYSDMPLEKFFLRPYKVMTVKVTNHSDKTYYYQNNNQGIGSIRIVAVLYDENDHAIEIPWQQNVLAHDLSPGETLYQKIIVSYQRYKRVSSEQFYLTQVGGVTTMSR